MANIHDAIAIFTYLIFLMIFWNVNKRLLWTINIVDNMFSIAHRVKYNLKKVFKRRQYSIVLLTFILHNDIKLSSES